MTWEIILVSEVEEWFLDLDESLSDQVRDCIERLAEHGPILGRPYADHIEGSAIHVAGDKVGHWRRWYSEAVKLAEQRDAQYLRTNPEEIS